MITMDDIVRDTDNNPVLRTRAAKVDFPLSGENQQLAQQLMEYLENSQNEEIAEKYQLRAGVGLAAPQVNHGVRMTAVLIPGYVPRHDRITLKYQNLAGETKQVRLKHYPAIVVQHELDHLIGVLFYDHIDENEPFNHPDDLMLLS